ncbi:MAG: acetate--CoA ligase family protein [bacterium]|nr:acetate--CoA ligase family protein [bacterium]
MDAFFMPRGCAVVGASRDPGKPGHQVLRNMQAAGYRGQLYPVNPREKEILGLPCYPDLLSIEGLVDLAVVCVPAAVAAAVLDDVARRRASRGDLGALISTPGGYAETGTNEGRTRQATLERFCRERGVLHLGPNCIGVIDNLNRVDTTFLLGTAHVPGGISFISQSGALGAWLLQSWSSRPRPTGFNRFISLGNMVGVDLVQALEYLGGDPATAVIGLYLEGYADGRLLLETAAAVDKPVVVLKVGVTPAGRTAAQSHTGALAGEDELYDAAFRQYGLVRARTMEELMDTLQAFDTLPSPRGNRVFLMTHAGGPGVYATDALAALPELEFARVADSTRRELETILPPFSSICRPEGHLDMTASGTVDQHARALETLLADDGVDAVLLLDLPTLFLSAEDLAAGLVRAYRRASARLDAPKPFLPCLMAGKWVAQGRRLLEEAGIPTFETPDRAARALVNLLRHRRLGEGARRTLAMPRPAATPEPTGRRVLTEPEAYRRLEEQGIAVARWREAGDAAAAARVAAAIGFPVALKLVSPDLPHKSDAGAVVLGLRRPEEVSRAWRQAEVAARAHLPRLRLRGAVLQRMARGREMIVGGLRDPQFGPVVMVGMGGVLAEHFRDVAFRLAPVDHAGARAMIGELQGLPVLMGARGTPPADLDALAGMVAVVSRFLASATDVLELDLNPVMAGVPADGCQAVDALLVVTESSR